MVFRGIWLTYMYFKINGAWIESNVCSKKVFVALV